MLYQEMACKMQDWADLRVMVYWVGLCFKEAAHFAASHLLTQCI